MEHARPVRASSAHRPICGETNGRPCQIFCSIPRKTFFGNANALNPQLSPEGRWLAWIAPTDGVMNIWAAPRDDVTTARPLTRQTDRPIFDHLFARTNAHVLFRKDKDGDENFNLWCVGT